MKLSFSTKDVSDMFGIEEDKISSLTIECLKSGKKQLTKKRLVPQSF